ncbi:MAG TPA: divalent metal cation transporter [Gemmatimonadaceae bacterium]
MRPWVRSLITRRIAIVPEAAVAILYGESRTTHLLALCKVILSLPLSFAVYPLVRFAAERLC